MYCPLCGRPSRQLDRSPIPIASIIAVPDTTGIQVADGLGSVTVCEHCGTLYGTCRLTDYPRYVEPYLVNRPVPEEMVRYFDFRCDSHKGTVRRNGLYDPVSRHVVRPAWAGSGDTLFRATILWRRSYLARDKDDQPVGSPSPARRRSLIPTRVSRHCYERFLSRRLEMDLKCEDLPWHIRQSIRKVVLEEIARGWLVAEYPGKTRAMLCRDWVYIVGDDTVVTVFHRIKGDIDVRSTALFGRNWNSRCQSRARDRSRPRPALIAAGA